MCFDCYVTIGQSCDPSLKPTNDTIEMQLGALYPILPWSLLFLVTQVYDLAVWLPFCRSCGHELITKYLLSSITLDVWGTSSCFLNTANSLWQPKVNRIILTLTRLPPFFPDPPSTFNPNQLRANYICCYPTIF